MIFPFNARVWIVAVIGYLLLIEQQWKLNHFNDDIDTNSIPSLYEFEASDPTSKSAEYDSPKEDKRRPQTEPNHKKYSEERLYNLRYNFESQQDGISNNNRYLPQSSNPFFRLLPIPPTIPRTMGISFK
jgi:uncharacterized membrane protein